MSVVSKQSDLSEFVMNQAVGSTIQICVQILSGRVYTLDVEPYETIGTIKNLAQKVVGVPAYQQRIVYNGRDLDDHHTLQDYCIGQGAILHLMLVSKEREINLENHISRVLFDGNVTEMGKPIFPPQSIQVIMDSAIDGLGEPSISEVVEFRVVKYDPYVEFPGQFSYDPIGRTAFFSAYKPLPYESNFEINLKCRSSKALGDQVLECNLYFSSIPEPGIGLVLSRPGIGLTVLCNKFNIFQPHALTQLKMECSNSLKFHVASINAVARLLPSGMFFPIAHDSDVVSLQPWTIIAVQCDGDPVLGGEMGQPEVAPQVSFNVPFISRNELIVSENNYLGNLCFEGMFGEIPVMIRKIRAVEAGEKSEFVLKAHLDLLRTLHHPRIESLLAICRDFRPEEMHGTSALLVSEYLYMGSLMEFLHHKRRGANNAKASSLTLHTTPRDLTVKEKLRICMDICEGMRYLHECNVNHQDLRSANIMLDSHLRAKVCGFGLDAFRKIAVTRDPETMNIESVPWSAPEVLRGLLPFLSSADVYSFGALVWELFSEKIPWQGRSTHEVFELVATQGYSLAKIPTVFIAASHSPSQVTEPIPPSTQLVLMGLLEECFWDITKDVTKVRPTFSELLEYLRSLSAIYECVTVLPDGEEQIVPPAFRCPITGDVMVDPVLCADGHTYERAAILQWLQRCNRSPVSNAELLNRVLVPNVGLKNTIRGML
jgi:serine/threonine protein kinase